MLDPLFFLISRLNNACFHSKVFSSDYSILRFILIFIQFSVKKIQLLCKENTASLSREYSFSVRRIQLLCQENTASLSREYSFSLKRIQLLSQENTASLSREYSFCMWRLTDKYIRITVPSPCHKYLSLFLCNQDR